jgi:predicted ATPase
VINNKTDIINKINEWYSQREQIIDLNSQIEEIGSEKGIEKQIKKIMDEISVIKKQLPVLLSDEEEIAFSESKKLLQENDNNKKKILLDISCLSTLKDFNIFNSIDGAIASLSNEIHNDINEFYLTIEKETKSKWDAFVDNKILELEQTLKNTTNQSEVIMNSEVFKKGEQYYSDNNIYLDKEKQLKSEQDKMNDIIRLRNECELVYQSKEKIKMTLLDIHFNYYAKLLGISENLQEQKDDVKISSSINFDNVKFVSNVQTIFNQKTGDGKNYIDYCYQNFEEYKKTMIDIFGKTDDGKIHVKGSIQQAMISILSENYFSINYKVNYENDDLDSMSEGKKAFIVLRLLLDFENKEWPILIDQPEDDLDNRAIYDQLVMYLRTKKKQRQIILVTHNPNIVVGADSELVIVANQNGVNNRNQDDVKFEYFSSSLETTFKDASVDTILLSQGIREHVCDILEGGDKAFQIRERKYGYK